MRKFAFVFLLLTAVCYTAEQSVRSEFLFSYHSGDYEKAHSLLASTIQDPVSKRVWEERIHLQSDSLPPCDYAFTENKAARGMALLRIGKIQEAKAAFGDDWLSLLGLANLAWWQNDRNTARQYAQQALALEPENPNVIYVAGDYAPNTALSIELFTKFLGFTTEDPLQRQTAEYSIEFMKKTAGMQLNVPAIPSDFETVESQFKNERLLIKTKINAKQKVTLMLDTGAGGLILADEQWDPKLQTDMLLFGLGKTEAAKSTRIVLDQLSASNFSMKNAVGSISYAFRADGFKGIAGTSLFSNYLIFVPLKSGKDMILMNPCEKDALSCLEKRGLHFSSHITFPFQLVNKLIIVKGRIKNSPEDMDILIDTGATNSLISISAAKRWTHVNYALSRKMTNDVVGVAGKADQTLLAESVKVEFGPLSKTFNQMAAVNLAATNEAMQLELDFILGRDFLNGYSLLIDYPNLQITFLK